MNDLNSIDEYRPSTFLASRNPILFGKGVSKRVGEELQHFGCKKVIVVFDKGVQAAGIIDKILGYIHEADIETVLYDGVQPDPPDWSVEEAAEIGRAENVDGVVAVGGGSSLDTGKGVKILLTNPSPLSNYYLAHEDVQPDESKMKPIIVIPTTAGTGSEATPGGVITDTSNNSKQNIPCMSNLGIVDPELTIGLPLSVTATTAIDALCHATESYTSNKANAISDLLTERAITLIGRSLPVIFKDSTNIDAREDVQLAATLAGMGLMGPFCHIPHEIGLVMGIIFHIPHGTACGMCLPEGMQFIAPAMPEKVAHITRLLGGEVPDDVDPETLGEIAYKTIADLFELIGFPKLSQYCPTKEEAVATAKEVYATYQFIHSPRPANEEDVAKMIAKAYDR